MTATTRPNRTLFPLIAATLAFPLFLQLGPSGVGLARFPEAVGQNQALETGIPPVPLSLAIVSPLVLLFFCARLARGELARRSDRLLLPFLAFMTCSLIAWMTLAVASRGGLRGLLFVLQMAVPFAGYLVVVVARPTPGTIDRALRWMITVAGMVFVGILVQATVDYGSPFAIPRTANVRVGPLEVYQAHSYFPLVAAIVASVAFGYLLRGRATAWAGVAFSSGTIVTSVSWSKGALVVLALSVGSLALVRLARLRHGVPSLIVPTARIVLGLGLMVALAGALVATGPVVVERMFEFAAGDVSSVAARATYWRDGLEIVQSSLLFGAGYSPEYATTAGAVRVFASHNQYLDALFKGGLVTFLPFLWLSWRVAMVLIRAILSSEPGTIGPSPAASAAVPVLWVMVVSNLLQSNLTQPFSGILLWTLIGVAEAGIRGRPSLPAAGAPDTQAPTRHSKTENASA